MKSKDLIKILNKFDEEADVNIFLLETGKRIELNYSDIEVLSTNKIDINVHV